MDGSILLTATERKALLRTVRSGSRAFRRAQILLLLADGLSVREIRRVTYASFDLIADCVRQFRAGGPTASAGADRPADVVPAWLARVADWLTSATPEDFGY